MTETFRASDGARIEVHDNNSHIDIKCTGSITEQHFLSVKETQAAREFFQRERDEELGRWRWPENPDYVVYPLGDGRVDVLRERHLSDEFRGPGRQEGLTRAAAEPWKSDSAKNFYGAARAYFEAHPERKPWHAPDAGDHWALHIAHGMALSGDEYLYKYTRWGSQGRWGFVPTDGGSVLDPTDPTITVGRRIWPEDAS